MMVRNSRLMWTAIFTSNSQPCAVTDVLTDAMLGVGVDTMSAVILDVAMLSDMGIVVMTTPEITLEFVVGVAYAVDMVPGELFIIIIDIVSAIDIGMFADENVHGLAAVITPVEFTWLST